MKKSILFFLAIFALALASCSKKDAEKLLLTVPQNSKAVVLADVENIRQQMGAEGKKEIDQAFALVSQYNDPTVEQAKYFVSEDSQIDFSVPVCIFEFKNATIITFALKDAGKFRSDIESKRNATFQKEQETWHLPDNTVFVNGDQAWITSTYPEIQASDINSFTKLPKSSSMASVEYTKEMVEQDADIAALVDVSSLMEPGMGMNQRLLLNMIVDNPKYISSYINFEKGKILGEATMLNDKFKPSAFSLKPAKIDVGALKNFPGKGNVFFAGALDSATIKSLVSQIKNFIPVPPPVLSAIENIDGNIVASTYMGPSSQSNQGCLMITFNDNASAEVISGYLRDLAGSAAAQFQFQANGNSLIISTPLQQGQGIESVAGNFNGASIGLYLDSSSFQDNGVNIGAYINSLFLKLEDSDHVNLKLNVATKQGQNSLVSLLQMMIALSNRH